MNSLRKCMKITTTVRVVKQIIFCFIILFAFVLNAAQDSFNFVFMTDTHVGTSNGSRDLRAVVNDINQLQPLPEFAILSGDVTEYDMGTLLDTAKMILDELKIPYYVIPGNHDTKWSPSGGDKFKVLFGDDKFSFEQSGFRFLGFHQGPVLRMGEGFVSPNDLTWLQSELEKSAKKGEKNILVMHYPLDKTITNLEQILNILDGHKIVTTLHGHGHRNRVSEYSGISGVMLRSSLARRKTDQSKEILPKAGLPSEASAQAGYTIISYDGSDSLHFYEKNPNLSIPGRGVEQLTGGDFQFPNLPTSQLSHLLWHKMSTMVNLYSKPDSLPYPVGGDLSKDYLWKIETGDLITSEAVIHGNHAAVATVAGNIYKIDVNHGEIIWKKNIGSGVYASPAISRKVIVLSRADSLIQCLSMKNAKEIWSFKTRNALVAPPIIENGKVYCGSGDGYFYALSLKKGQLIWKYEGIGSYVESKALITKDKVIFTAWDETLRALDKKTGKECWVWQGGRHGRLYSPAACNPQLIDGVIYIVAPDRFLTAIDVETGQTLWRSNRYAVRENIASAEDGSLLFMKTMFDTVIAVIPDKNEFKLKWAVSGKYDFDINPAPMQQVGNMVWGTTHYGWLMGFDSNDGKMIVNKRFSKNLTHKPVVFEEKLVIISVDGGIIGIGTESVRTPYR